MSLHFSVSIFTYKQKSPLLNRLVSFGPKNCGPNLLLLSKDARIDVWPGLVPAKNTANSSSTVSGDVVTGLESSGDGKASKRNQMLCSITLQVRHYALL